MWTKYLISFAALIAAGCAVLPAAPLSANHPAHPRASPAPPVQSQILNTYRPAVETRVEPNKNSLTDTPSGTKASAAPAVDHAAMGHRGTQTTPAEVKVKPTGTPPATSTKDHAAMGHGNAKTSPPKTSPKRVIPAKPGSKDGHDGH